MATGHSVRGSKKTVALALRRLFPFSSAGRKACPCLSDDRRSPEVAVTVSGCAVRSSLLSIEG
jgi:hypothetical protein